MFSQAEFSCHAKGTPLGKHSSELPAKTYLVSDPIFRRLLSLMYSGSLWHRLFHCASLQRSLVIAAHPYGSFVKFNEGTARS